MNAGEALPALNQAMLDADTLRQLFFDIEHAARLLAVSVKREGQQNAEFAPIPLAELCESLIVNSLVGAQLRYLHGGREWWDTLLATPIGTRLVRIDHGPHPERAAR